MIDLNLKEGEKEVIRNAKDLTVTALDAIPWQVIAPEVAVLDHVLADGVEAVLDVALDVILDDALGKMVEELQDASWDEVANIALRGVNDLPWDAAVNAALAIATDDMLDVGLEDVLDVGLEDVLDIALDEILEPISSEGGILEKGARACIGDEASDIVWKALPEEVGETDNRSKKDIIEQNRINGARREAEVQKELEEKYKAEDGYEIRRQQNLRDKDGNIQKDPETGKKRVLDFVVLKNGKVVESIEVTSYTAEKTKQMAKEDRVREVGGNFIKDSKGDLVEIPTEIRTRLERRAFA